MTVRIIRQLLQHKVGNIGTRDFEFYGLVGAWKPVPIQTRTINATKIS